MLTPRTLLFKLLFLQYLIAVAQPAERVNEYLRRYTSIAIKQTEQFGIPASVILAQAIFESGCGRSELAQRSNNHFGIKCHNAWLGDTVTKTDDVANECFRKYRRVEDSYRDHSIFLRTRKWYTHLFRIPATDYRGWCRGLKEAGYATYPTYAEELINIIEKYGLWRLDAPEPLTPVLTIARATDIRHDSGGDPLLHTMNQFAQMDVLFSDESHFVLRSLDLHVTHDSPPVAGVRGKDESRR